MSLLKLDLDSNKRHLIVGDIHGRWDYFRQLLDKVNFDPFKDVIYSVGDLIDRGPDSVRVVKWFNSEPNAFVVMGNHEEMAIRPDLRSIWMWNGGQDTVRDLADNEKDEAWLISQIRDYPLVIEVGDSFRIVHAEFPLAWADANLHNFLEHYVAEEGVAGDNPLLWGRDVISMGHLYTPADNRTKVTYCGHTPIREVKTVHDHVFIDTWQGNKLTMVNPLTGEQHSVEYI